MTVPLAHHVAGSGTPQLVLVHGLFESADSWTGVAPLLVEAGFTVVTLDLRGHGDSPRPPHGYAPQQLADDVAALIDELALDRPVWVGHSMGARTGWFCASSGDRLSGLVIGDIGMEARPDSWKEVQSLVDAMPAAFASLGEVDAFLQAQVPADERAYFRRVLTARPELRPRFSFEAVVDIVRRGRAEDWIGMAPRIACPALLVRGEHSEELSREEAARVRAAIPRCDFVEIPGVGHDLHLCAPEAFANAVANWVRNTFLTVPD